MDIPDLTSLGAIGVPAFVAIFLMGWKSHDLVIGKPLAKRVEALEEDVESNRKERDAELAQLRQKVLG